MISPGTILQSRYRIGATLGKGGMGAVYEATDLKFGSTVAVKEMTLAGEELVRAFEREARLLNKLRHAALPVVIDYFAEEDRYFLVMQYIPGRDLAASLAARGAPFPAEEVLGWADQLLGALAFLHTQEPPIIHRDIKPHNLKLTPGGEVILLDFGLSKSAGAAPTGGGTSVSVLGYTPHYAPFEQINGAGTDPRSDLFSLAATMYHLLTGALPPDAVTRAQAIMNDEPDPLRPAHEINPAVPSAVASFLHNALAMNREQRPSSAVVMREALRSVRMGMAVASSIHESSQPTLLDGPGTVPTHPSLAPPLTTQAPTVTGVTDGHPTGAAAPHGAPSRARYARLATAGALGLILAICAVVWAAWPQPPAADGVNPSGAAHARGHNLPPPEITFRFETVGLGRGGAVVARRRLAGKHYEEDLGGGQSVHMVVIPAGTFTMGTPDGAEQVYPNEGPAHQVSIREFYLSMYEVTQRQWRAVATELPKVLRDLPPAPSAVAGDDLPVTDISWTEAVEFCERLTRKTGRHYRLPSEAEWEYAARAGTTTAFAFGETVTTEFVNYDGTEPHGGGPAGVSRGRPVPVGSLKAANAFGLYDTHGNVWEWCAGAYHADYRGAPTDGSAWNTGGDAVRRVLRGGSYKNLSEDCRSANRYGYPMDGRSAEIGFRLAASAS
jgi:formylglycine-generating enzyme required for sulfatase activity